MLWLSALLQNTPHAIVPARFALGSNVRYRKANTSLGKSADPHVGLRRVNFIKDPFDNTIGDCRYFTAIMPTGSTAPSIMPQHVQAEQLMLVPCASSTTHNVVYCAALCKLGLNNSAMHRQQAPVAKAGSVMPREPANGFPMLHQCRRIVCCVHRAECRRTGCCVLMLRADAANKRRSAGRVM